MQRAAELIRDWRECSLEQQVWLERTAKKMAALRKKNRWNLDHR